VTSTGLGEALRLTTPVLRRHSAQRSTPGKRPASAAARSVLANLATAVLRAVSARAPPPGAALIPSSSLSPPFPPPPPGLPPPQPGLVAR
jgi:hypothetical protein